MTQPSVPEPAPRTDLVRASVIVIALVLGLLVLWYTRFLILITVFGTLLGLAATPAVNWLERRRVRRQLGAPLVVLGTGGLILAVMLWSGPTIATQMQALRQQVPAAIDKVDAFLAGENSSILDKLLPRDAATRPDGTPAERASERLQRAVLGQTASLRAALFGAVTSTIAIAAGMVYVVFFTIYVAISPQVYRRGILLLIPAAARERGALVFDGVAATLRKWLQTQFIAMVVIGALTTSVLFILDVKSAIPLGLLAGILEFVPNVGPVLSAIPAVLIAFADAPEKALAVLLAYWGIQFLENNLLIPYLMSEELDLPPALTLIFQAFMAVVFGLLGLFVAVPLLAAIVVAVRQLYVRGDVPPVHQVRGSREMVAAVSDLVTSATK